MSGLVGTPLADLAGMHPPARIPLALFLTSFSPGGTERQMIELLRRLDRRRFEVHLACFHRSGEWVRRAEELAESVAEFPIPSFRSAAAARQAIRFARWCRARRLAVLHTCDLYTNTFGLPAAALARVPVRIANRRELNPDKSPGQIAAQRAAYSFATAVVANSAAARDRLRLERVPARRLAVIPNGIDLAEFRPAGEPERAGAAADARCRVLTVARFRPEKGLDTFVEAARLALARVPGLEFTLAGDGPLAADLQHQARSAGLGDRLAFPGLRLDVPRLLREHDVFALPSRSEAFPNAVLEAMAAGLAIVATRVGGVPQLIEDGQTGLLVEPDRPAELAAAIVQLATGRERARALGRRARASAEASYSFDLMVSRFERLYLDRLAASRTPVHGRPRSSQPVAS